VPTREERLAANEARFRDINEAAQPQREEQGGGRFVCECADRNCAAWLTLTLAEYAAVRRNPRRFVVAPGHEPPDIEQVVERHDGWLLIEKPDEVAHIVEN
jgi:hypothetical protein